jgi:sigma-B regulation protein RsbU (phosphoserine phosphatase)
LTADPQDPHETIGRLERRLQQLASLMEVSRLVGSSLDLSEVLNRVMLKAQEVADAEASCILLMNERTGKLEVEVAIGGMAVTLEELKKRVVLEPGQGIAGAVALSRAPELVPDVAADPRTFRAAEKVVGVTFRSLMVAPLIVHDKLVGVAEVFNPRGGGRFTPEDLDLFSTYCHQVAVAIENARLHRALVEREREKQQLELASLVQQSFLPKRLPEGGGRRFTLEARTVPAATVAGDLYDFVERRGDRLVVLVGDVSGKGFPAALMMAKVISDFRPAAHHAPSPAAILGHLNTELVRHNPRGMFVTAACLALDVDAGRMLVSNAGHLPPLWHRQSAGTVLAYEGDGGPPLGILPGARFPDQELVMGEGDTLLLYTDGVIEAGGPGDTSFGVERLAEAMRSRLPSSGDLVGDLLEVVRSHSGGGPPADDLTLVALRWAPRT